MSELLPCPFCGGEALAPQKSSGSDERNGYNFTVTIRCSKCRVSIVAPSHEGSAGWCDDTGQAEAQATAAWNRRAVPNATPLTTAGTAALPPTAQITPESLATVDQQTAAQDGEPEFLDIDYGSEDFTGFRCPHCGESWSAP